MPKTVTIDDEAYRILNSHKFPGESFSDVIKKNMLEALFGRKLDKVLAEAMERQIARERQMAKSRKKRNGASRGR